MKAWLVRYALSGGIQEVEASVKGRYFKVEGYCELFGKQDLAFSLEKAQQQAIVKRDKKVVALEKQIEKLKKLEF